MGNEVTKIEQSELPAHLRQHVGIGEDDINVSELKMPYISLAQSSSKAVKAKAVSYGEFYNSITKEAYGDSVSIIVIKMESNWVKFPTDEEKDAAEKKDEFAPIRRSKDGLNWDDGSELTSDEFKMNKEFVFFCLLRDHLSELPLAITFKSTSSKAGRSLYQVISQNVKVNKEPIMGRAYKLTATEQKFKKGEVMVFNDSVADGWASEDEVNLAVMIRANIEKFQKAHEASNGIDEDVIAASSSSKESSINNESYVIEDEDKLD